MELNINSPSYYTQEYGVIDEVYKMCRELAAFVRPHTYSELINIVGITPIVAPIGETNIGRYKEVKHCEVKSGFANVSLRINYEHFTQSDVEEKKVLIIENILQSVNAISKKAKFDMEAFTKDVMSFCRAAQLNVNPEDSRSGKEKVVEIMRTGHNITFAPGLTNDEISSIETRYNIRFPKSLRDFLMQALPVSEGFYNWRDSSVDNIRYIKKAIARPIEMLKELAEEVEWCEEWGKAPVLIPVYAHRYMPMVEAENPPILSVHGTDIIYYGENLSDYLDIEFGTKKQTDIAFDRIQPVPFWSEIMQRF